MKRIRIIVNGKVQGVFYRINTIKIAQSLSIYGFVKNNADGSVLIDAEGEEPNLRSLVEWCRVGPPTARVDSVSTEQLNPLGYTDFEVRL